MSKETAKTRAADKKAVRKAGQAALNVFDMDAFMTVFTNIGAVKSKNDQLLAQIEKNEGKGKNHSLEACKLATEYREAALKVTDDHSTVLADWLANVELLKQRLLAEGSPLVVDNGKKGAKWTNYGNNVASQCKGCVEFGYEIDNDTTYTAVREWVQSDRAERKREELAKADPGAVMITDARKALKLVCDDIVSVYNGVQDHELISEMANALDVVIQEKKDEFRRQEEANKAAADAARDMQQEAAAA